MSPDIEPSKDLVLDYDYMTTIMVMNIIIMLIRMIMMLRIMLMMMVRMMLYLVVNSLPQKKQRKNFIRPFELSTSLV